MTRARLVILVLLLAGSLFAGWQARGWYEQANRLTAERVARQAIDAAMARESTIATAVEARLAELEASERVIDRGIIREIQRPVYRRVCLEPRLVRLLNDAAAGRAPDAAQLDAALPREAAPAD